MMETASESAAKHQTAETDSAAKHQTAETASAAKRQTTETALGSGTSAVEFLEKEISNLKHLGSDKSEKDKSSGEKVEDSGTQRKRRLSTVSQKSEYMPDPKTAKKRTSDEKESIPSTSEKSGVSKQNNSRSDSVRSERPGVYQPKTDRKTSKEEDSKPGDSAKPKTDRKIKTNSGVSEKPGVSKPKTARKSSREEDPRPADSAKRKDADRKKTIEKAAKMTDITNVPNEKSPEPKSKPVWNASSVEKHTQKKAESTVTEKVKKRVTFGENIRYPAAGTSMGPDTSKGPVSTKGPETTQKSSTNTNQRDPRPTKQAIVDRPNLMLKTPIQV